MGNYSTGWLRFYWKLFFFFMEINESACWRRKIPPNQLLTHTLCFIISLPGPDGFGNAAGGPEST